MDTYLVGLIATMMMTIIGTVWSLALWLTRQFSSIKQFVQEKIDVTYKELRGKLEYHERHDDQRFEQLRRELWEIRLDGMQRRTRNFAQEEITTRTTSPGPSGS